MSSKFYILTTVVLLVIAGWLFLGPTSEKQNSGELSSEAIDMGDYQKVVLGMKNYNYYPSTVTVEAGKPVRIYLDNSVQGCYRAFTIKSFGVSKLIGSSKDYVEFTPNQKGSYGFACSMGMGRGTLIVK